jgi:hypothetical protein
MRHRAASVCRRDSLEFIPCLWIRHVMQEGDRSIELHLGLFGAGDGKVDRAQRVAGVLLDLGSRFARDAPEHDDHQTDIETKEDGMTGAPYGLTWFPPREFAACHTRSSHSPLRGCLCGRM